MPNTVARLLLFLSSYFPLAVIFFLLLLGKHPLAAIAILFVGTAGLSGMVAYLRVVNHLSGISVKVAELQRRDEEAMSYIVSYIIPFLSIPFSGWQEAAALAVFIAVLGVLYINSNMIHINPMLNLAGYHLYEVRLAGDSTHFLVARRRLARGETLTAVTVGDGILLEKESK
jgi:hypothetical protein